VPDVDTGRTVPDQDRPVVGAYLTSQFNDHDDALTSLIEAHLPRISREEIETFARHEIEERMVYGHRVSHDHRIGPDGSAISTRRAPNHRLGRSDGSDGPDRTDRSDHSERWRGLSASALLAG
jgi:hypothetical protein